MLFASKQLSALSNFFFNKKYITILIYFKQLILKLSIDKGVKRANFITLFFHLNTIKTSCLLSSKT